MDIKRINKARVFLFIAFICVFLTLHSIALIKLGAIYNSLFLIGIIIFFISVASILEKITVDTILINIEDKKRSRIHDYVSFNAIKIFGIALISLLVIITLLAIYYYVEEKSNNWLVLLFGSSLSLLNLSFLVDTGRLVFINNEYILYHQVLYKKVVAYQHVDASLICIVEDGKGRRKKAELKFKNIEVKI